MHSICMGADARCTALLWTVSWGKVPRGTGPRMTKSKWKAYPSFRTLPFGTSVPFKIVPANEPAEENIVESASASIRCFIRKKKHPLPTTAALAKTHPRPP